jgi:hypothetical protein
MLLTTATLPPDCNVFVYSIGVFRSGIPRKVWTMRTGSPPGLYPNARMRISMPMAALANWGPWGRKMRPGQCLPPAKTSPARHASACRRSSGNRPADMALCPDSVGRGENAYQSHIVSRKRFELAATVTLRPLLPFASYPFARLTRPARLALLIRPFERALFPRRVRERLLPRPLRRAAIEMSRSVKDCRPGEN